MKCETPARERGSSREPVAIQSPRATDRTPGMRSLAIRSPPGSVVMSGSRIGGDRSRLRHLRPVTDSIGSPKTEGEALASPSEPLRNLLLGACLSVAVARTDHAVVVLVERRRVRQDRVLLR